MTYVLNVAFTQDQLDAIYATNSRLIIAKSASSDVPNVAWQAFQPVIANSITWEENYGLYFSNTSVIGGVTITQFSRSEISIASQQLYTINTDGIITDSGEKFGEPGQFALQNTFSMYPYLTIGLYQNAAVKGLDVLDNPISAKATLLHSIALITPNPHVVYIWLQSDILPGTIVTQITAPVTKLQFGSEDKTITVAYDTASGTFSPSL